MTRMRILLLVLTLGVALCLPQAALATSSTTVKLSGAVASVVHAYPACTGAGNPFACCTAAGQGTCTDYALKVTQSDGATLIGSKSSGPHASGTAAATVANANTACTALSTPFACCTGAGTGTCGLGGAYDPTLSGVVSGADVTLIDLSERIFRVFVSVDGGAFSEVTNYTSQTLKGIKFILAYPVSVPALSLQGLLIFLLIASGALFVLRRRHSGRMGV